MGFYNDGNIYGVKWFTLDSSGYQINEFEKIYDNKMNELQIQEVKKEYDKLTQDDISNIRIQFYTGFSTTYDLGLETDISKESGTSRESKCWWPGSVMQIEELFKNGDTII